MGNTNVSAHSPSGAVLACVADDDGGHAEDDDVVSVSNPWPEEYE